MKMYWPAREAKRSGSRSMSAARNATQLTTASNSRLPSAVWTDCHLNHGGGLADGDVHEPRSHRSGRLTLRLGRHTLAVRAVHLSGRTSGDRTGWASPRGRADP